MKYKVLITGATGFIGRHLTRFLKLSGYTVGAIIRDRTFRSEYIDYYIGTSELSSAFNEFNPDITIHLAASYSDDIDLLIDSNIALPVKLLGLISKQDIKRRNFISTGSYWQFGDASNKYTPLDNYSSSKQALTPFFEQYVHYCNLNISELFIYGTYGASDGRGKVLDYILNCAINHTECLLTEGEQKLNMVHIDDVCKAYSMMISQLLARAEIKLHQYGVYSSDSYTIKEIIAEINKISNLNVKAIFGAKKYRSREIFEPSYNYANIPGWKPSIRLLDYISKRINYHD